MSDHIGVTVEIPPKLWEYIRLMYKTGIYGEDEGEVIISCIRDGVHDAVASGIIDLDREMVSRDTSQLEMALPEVERILKDSLNNPDLQPPEGNVSMKAAPEWAPGEKDPEPCSQCGATAGVHADWCVNG